MKQPGDTEKPISERAAPIPAVEREENVVEKTVVHKRRGRGYQTLTVMIGDPSNDSIDREGTFMEVWFTCIRDHNIAPQYN